MAGSAAALLRRLAPGVAQARQKLGQRPQSQPQWSDAWPAVDASDASEGESKESLRRRGSQTELPRRRPGERDAAGAFAAAHQRDRSKGVDWQEGGGKSSARQQGGGSSRQLDLLECSEKMASCVRKQDWQEALQLLQLLRQNSSPSSHRRAAEPSNTRSPTQICNSAIAACRAASQWQVALSLFVEMHDSGPAPTVVTYNSTISALERARCWQHALALYADMVPRRLRPNLITCNSALKACATGGGHPPLARQLLVDLRELGLLPDAVTVSAAAGALRGGALSRASGDGDEAAQGAQLGSETVLQLLAEVEARASCDVIAYGAAISSCASDSQWAAALRLLFINLEAQGLKPSLAACGAALDACEAGHAWASALHLLHAMRQSSSPAAESPGDHLEEGRTARPPGEDQIISGGLWPRPDARCFEAALGSCQQAHMWEAALRLLDDMQGPDCTTRHSRHAAGSSLDVNNNHNTNNNTNNNNNNNNNNNDNNNNNKISDSGAARVAPPKVDHLGYHLVISACSNASQWQRGLALLTGLSARSLAVEAGTFRSTLLECEEEGRAVSQATLLQLLSRKAFFAVGSGTAPSRQPRGGGTTTPLRGGTATSASGGVSLAEQPDATFVAAAAGETTPSLPAGIARREALQESCPEAAAPQFTVVSASGPSWAPASSRSPGHLIATGASAGIAAAAETLMIAGCSAEALAVLQQRHCRSPGTEELLLPHGEEQEQGVQFADGLCLRLLAALGERATPFG
ncbi:unnamed protein product [Polarella glacialis]|uniref:Pentacotripeptide-repeat region of PRORP domain-containing protein n=1 Tax=Polarella glacialis TaxID=89957 RepID=A0A813LTF7_POLGL|nr:unnamed protein product [Polarella glacialis]